MNKNLTYVIPVVVTVLIVMLLGSTISAYGQFSNIPPIKLRTADGKQYKFDIDILQDTGHGTGEPSTVVNHQANGDIVKLKRGEQITITYGSPFGFSDFIKGSLLKGRVVTSERLNEKVNVFGIQTVFLQGSAPPESADAQIPQSIRIGPYNLVILITYNEEIRGYYITNAIVS